MVSVKERSVLASFGSLLREDPVRAEINKVISYIKAANYSTLENTPEEAGYPDKESERGKNPVAIHVVEYVTKEKPVMFGLITREIQQRNPVCVIQYFESAWTIPEKDIHNTEKLSQLYQHLRYYGLKIHMEGAPEEILDRIYIEAREARPGAKDPPPKPDS